MTAPFRASDRLISGFVADSAAWIEKALQVRRADPASVLPRMTPAVREQARRDTRILVAHRLAHFNQTYQLTWVHHDWSAMRSVQKISLDK